MDVVGFFFVGVFAEGVDGLAAVEFAVVHVFGRAHDGDIQLTMTGADVVPVDEVDMRELAAIEDAVAMWDYLMYMGYGARDVIIAGDSAGGNLALELALKLKEQGRAQPRGLVLFSPWTDMTASGKSYRTCKTLDPMLTMEYIAAVREAYTGPDADWSRPCYSPLFADLRGLPPTLVQVGTNEILKSDSERLVENLQKAGVYAQLEVYPECWHVFQQMPIRRAAVAMESAGRFVQRII